MSIDSLNPAAMMATTSLPDASELQNKEMGEAAEQFEGYMVEMMVREMRKTIPEGKVVTYLPKSIFHNRGSIPHESIPVGFATKDTSVLADLHVWKVVQSIEAS